MKKNSLGGETPLQMPSWLGIRQLVGQDRGCGKRVELIVGWECIFFSDSNFFSTFRSRFINTNLRRGGCEN